MKEVKVHCTGKSAAPCGYCINITESIFYSCLELQGHGGGSVLETICVLVREHGTSSSAWKGLWFVTTQRKVSLNLIPSFKLSAVLQQKL